MSTTKDVLEQVAALRQEVETQTAINIVEAINAAETLALLGHWMRTRRPPEAKEVAQLEKLARARLFEQIRQVIKVSKAEAGGLNESLELMLGSLGGPRPEPAPRAKKRPRRR